MGGTLAIYKMDSPWGPIRSNKVGPAVTLWKLKDENTLKGHQAAHYFFISNHKNQLKNSAGNVVGIRD